jgi:hypothetical protein
MKTLSLITSVLLKDEMSCVEIISGIGLWKDQAEDDRRSEKTREMAEYTGPSDLVIGKSIS